MKQNLKLILTILVTCHLSLVTSFATAKEVTTEAQGIGDDYDWAVATAIDNAVKQTSEIKVERNAPIEKATIKAQGIVDIDASAEIKNIDARYKGRVKSFEVLSTEEKKGKTYVKIKAVILQPDDYTSPGLGQKGKYSLSIVPFKGPKNFPCMGTSISSDNISKQLNNGLVADIQKSKKFNIVDRQNMDSYAEEALLIEADLAKNEYKNKMKQITSADYLLVGSVDGFATSSAETHIELTRELYIDSAASMQVSYRLIETATMEIIASGVVEKSITKEGAFSSCPNVAKALGQKISKQISGEMLAELFPDMQPQPKVKPKGGAQKKYQPAPPPIIKLPFDD